MAETLVRRFIDFYPAWQFLYNHPIFIDNIGLERFDDCLNIEVVKVNPKTKRIEKDVTKNTATRVWLECGPWLKPEQLDEFFKSFFAYGMTSHDINLDCGARTFEKAIVKLANLVLKHYGDGQNGQK